jgi:hypothetical protein
MIDLVDENVAIQTVLDSLRDDGVWMTAFGPRRLRAVTHMDVGDPGIELAVAALRRALASAAQDGARAG